MSCLNPGDEIIVPEPAYANYMAFAISAGAVIRPVVSSIEQGFALPDVAEFEKLINDRTRGILICNPNNPTGYLYTRKEMNRIRDLVKEIRPVPLLRRSLPRIHLYGVALYLGLPSGGDRAERGADRLGVEALLGVRHPHRGAHHQKPCAARRRDEVLPGAPDRRLPGVIRTDRRRGRVSGRHTESVFALS